MYNQLLDDPVYITLIASYYDPVKQQDVHLTREILRSDMMREGSAARSIAKADLEALKPWNLEWTLSPMEMELDAQ
jgi:hypothetical protein